jgi:hypothetical protein
MTTALIPTSPAPAPEADALDAALARIAALPLAELRDLWRERLNGPPPAALSKDLMARVLAQRLQEARFGGLDAHLVKRLASVARGGAEPARRLQIGSALVREHEGRMHEVIVAPDGFYWQGETHSSLSAIARKITGVSWSGPRFFGLLASAKEATAATTSEEAGEGLDGPVGSRKRRGRPRVAPVRPRERAP